MKKTKRETRPACPICKRTPCKCGYMGYYQSKGDGRAGKEPIATPEPIQFAETPKRRVTAAKKKTRK